MTLKKEFNMVKNNKEVLLGSIIDEMENFYEANVALMILSRPGMGKTERISQEAKRILVKQFLGDKKASKEADEYAQEEAKKAFFIVDMSGVPSESLAVPYIAPMVDTTSQRIQLLNLLANPEADDSVKAIAKDELEKLVGVKVEQTNQFLRRDVIQEIRDMQLWLANHDEDKKCIVLVDEITSANQDDQRTLMNFIQSGICPDGQKVDLNRVWFVLAGNPSSEMPGYEDYDGATNNIEEAVITRCATFFAHSSVDEVLDWGKQTAEDGDTNIHPYLVAALEKDRTLYMKKAEDEIRLMNSRTLFKLSEYFRATTRIGKKWQAESVNALVGEQVGTVLCAIIEKLDRLVSLKELFGSDKTKKLNEAAFAKFKQLQEFEKYYILSSALDESSPIKINQNNVRKIMQLLDEGGVPAETLSSISMRIIKAPVGTKLRELTYSKYLLDPELNLIRKCQEIRNFSQGAAFN